MSETPFTTPDGRTVDDVIDGQYDELIDNLTGAIIKLLEHGNVLRTRYDDAAHDGSRSDVVYDNSILADVAQTISEVRDDLRTRDQRAAFTP